jgi:hypothetical protein
MIPFINAEPWSTVRPPREIEMHFKRKNEQILDISHFAGDFTLEKQFFSGKPASILRDKNP